VIDRLKLLYVTLFPASPPRFGAQRRLQGLMAGLARRNDITAVSFLTPDLDAGEAEHAMRAYGRDVVFIPSRPWTGAKKRLLQARSLLSLVSFERRFFTLPAAQQALDRLLRGQRYDIVNIEAPFLARYRMAQAPPGERIPRLVLDQHNIEFDLVRQMAKTEQGFARRLYNSADWPKIRHPRRAGCGGAHGPGGPRAGGTALLLGRGGAAARGLLTRHPLQPPPLLMAGFVVVRCGHADLA
jgi:hypothetical protein